MTQILKSKTRMDAVQAPIVAVIGALMVPIALSLRTVDLQAPARGH